MTSRYRLKKSLSSATNARYGTFSVVLWKNSPQVHRKFDFVEIIGDTITHGINWLTEINGK
jgi:hypothetical protein